MASAELRTVLQQMQERQAEAAANPPADLAAMRAGMEERSFPATQEAAVTPVDAHGVRGEWVTVAEADPRRRLLYLHGGGYVIGSALTHRRLCEDLSRASGCAVLNLDYRLAPEHPFPAAVEDAVAALAYVQANGAAGPGAAEAVFVAGDSAGGGLTLATLVAARERGMALPQAAAGLSAWTDLAMTGESLETRRGIDPLITDPGMVADMALQYLQGQDPRTPLASPLYADLTGLPPLLLQVGDHEVLLDDTTRVAERARAAGVDVTLEVWPEMFHVWQAFAPLLPEGREAVERIGAFLRQRVPAAATGD